MAGIQFPPSRPQARRRLRVAASMTLGVYTYFVALWASNEGYDLRQYGLPGLVYLTLIHGTFLAELFAAGLLWRRPLPWAGGSVVLLTRPLG